MEEKVIKVCPNKDCDFTTTESEDIYCGHCPKTLLVIQCPSCKGHIKNREIVSCTLCGENLLVQTFDFSGFKGV